ncbi:hypothetical protein FKM82_015552 [Ascaphus truei]
MGRDLCACMPAVCLPVSVWPANDVINIQMALCRKKVPHTCYTVCACTARSPLAYPPLIFIRSLLRKRVG